jgi:hypothetical protein
LLDAVKQQGAYLHKALREVLGSYRMSAIRADAACLPASSWCAIKTTKRRSILP